MLKAIAWDAGIVLREMWSSARGYWDGAEGYQRFLYVVAAALFASGVFHAGVFLVDGGSWEGPISWRKPIVFGLSFGFVSLSLAWVMTFLPRRRVWGWLLMGTFGLASVVEVFLIDLQRWRGVASHFNSSTAFDEAVFAMMGNMVALVALVIVVVTAWTFFSLDAPPSFAWAIRVGMVLLIAGQILGVFIIVNGNSTLDAGGAEPAIFGAAGVIKAPHAIALHAIQALPLLAWLFLFTGWSERRRTQAVVAACVGYAGLVGVGTAQTFAGLAPFDLGLSVALVLAASGFLLAGSYALALLALRQSPAQVTRD